MVIQIPQECFCDYDHAADLWRASTVWVDGRYRLAIRTGTLSTEGLTPPGATVLLLVSGRHPFSPLIRPIRLYICRDVHVYRWTRVIGPLPRGLCYPARVSGTTRFGLWEPPGRTVRTAPGQ